MVSFSLRFSLLSFCLADLSTGDSWVLKSPTLTVLELMSSFIVNSFFYETGCPCVRCIYVWDCNFFFMDFSFSMSALTSFSLKSILSNIIIATPACFLVPFGLEYLFPSFYPKVIFLIDGNVFLGGRKLMDHIS